MLMYGNGLGWSAVHEAMISLLIPEKDLNAMFTAFDVNELRNVTREQHHEGEYQARLVKNILTYESGIS
uniref:AlNc14C372G11120 protein n=1 Tax=Albugo laibachii Nc14 TaxID=890382 RepID=F0WY60_9STRA|nr:AlNc14C372G11120 [Albugo laibachii Nc14]|eukprot:CCA26411.1 AlNc14C372G11120 [Albugo laibachii Nc14]